MLTRGERAGFKELEANQGHSGGEVSALYRFSIICVEWFAFIFIYTEEIHLKSMEKSRAQHEVESISSF